MTDLLSVNGGSPLHGSITVRGAKNFVSKAMVAALLGEGPSVLRNVPQIRDVAVVTGLLELHGVTKSITFPATIAVTNEAVTANADFAIDRTNWGINYEGMADNLIRKDVVLKLAIKAPRNKG